MKHDGKRARLWTRLNPREPTPLYLAKFIAVAVALFTAAYFVGVGLHG